MLETKLFAPGTFCWTDLATTDAPAAKSFYCQLFGWEACDEPVPDGTYTMLLLNGKKVGALYQLSNDQRAQGIPPHWLSYVASEQVDDMARKAKELGAELLMPPFDVMGAGRMVVVKDPTGAVFALWQAAKGHEGSEVMNGAPGSVIWNELATKDSARSEAFYTALFGWQPNKHNITGMPYTEFLNRERPAAGMMQMTAEWGNAPPHWMVYFAVTDCEAITRRARELGGTVIVEPTTLPEVGSFAILQDPQGAVFSIMKPIS
ncbi:MAG: VOC family protein [Cyanobacteria bacterium NC_groundwater_1444_Ag_S-0.65um_54_12]|nr:VOC family protein [Cyanobacteria bacterium NC_groundwater_1444_Ag_S-0.65um_54_12]